MDEPTRSETALRDTLEEIVEAEMALARLQARLAALVDDDDDRARADSLARDLRDILDRASGRAERALTTRRAELGIHPDD